MARRLANHDAVERAITEAVGPPVVDPQLKLRRWVCPVCGGGADDPLKLWRPMTLRGDGLLACDACGADPAAILAAVERAAVE